MEMTCPKCKEKKLVRNTYHYTNPSGDDGYYYVKCNNCGFVGRQKYKLTFRGYADEMGNHILTDVCDPNDEYYGKKIKYGGDNG